VSDRQLLELAEVLSGQFNRASSGCATLEQCDWKNGVISSIAIEVCAQSVVESYTDETSSSLDAQDCEGASQVLSAGLLEHRLYYAFKTVFWPDDQRAFEGTGKRLCGVAARYLSQCGDQPRGSADRAFLYDLDVRCSDIDPCWRESSP
jgi:hypothetical protein